MKILIYLTGGVHWLGGVQYTRNLLNAISLLSLHERPEIILQIGRKNRGQGFEEEFSHHPNVKIDKPINKNFALGYTVLSLLRRVRRRLSGVDTPEKILLSDDCAVAFPAKASNLPGRSRKVFWVPDFQYKHFPSYFSTEERRERDEAYEKMFSEEGILVLSSKVVEKDFFNFFPSHKNKKVRILNFTSTIDAADYKSDPAVVCAENNLPKYFIYLPNQMWQHKGFDTTILALSILRQQGITPQLVCTGNPNDYRNDKYYQEMRQLIEANGLTKQIHMLGMLPRTTQLQLFRRAAFVLQPSRFEGWSTSVEDARAFGKSILLSDIPVHREQNPNYVTFFATGDENDLADKIGDLWARSESGPNMKQERFAHEASVARSISYAKNFLSIMTEALKN